MTDSFDSVPFGRIPPGGGCGTKAIEGRKVRFMIANPVLTVSFDDVPFAYNDMSIAEAVQVVQALRQAIGDARKGKVTGR